MSLPPLLWRPPEPRSNHLPPEGRPSDSRFATKLPLLVPFCSHFIMLRFELLPQSAPGRHVEAVGSRSGEGRGVEGWFHVPLLFTLDGPQRGTNLENLAARSLLEAQQEQRPQPASREAVESLNVREASQDDDDNCAVCLDALREGRARLMDMPCGHAFHERCLRQWLGESHRCPTCRIALPSTPSSPQSAPRARPEDSSRAPSQNLALVLAAPPQRVRRARPQARRQRRAGDSARSAPTSLPMLPHEVLQFSQRLHQLTGLDPCDPPAIPITATALERVPTQPARSRPTRPRPGPIPPTASPVQPPPRVPSDRELIDSAVDELLAA